MDIPLPLSPTVTRDSEEGIDPIHQEVETSLESIEITAEESTPSNSISSSKSKSKSKSSDDLKTTKEPAPVLKVKSPKKKSKKTPAKKAPGPPPLDDFESITHHPEYLKELEVIRGKLDPRDPPPLRQHFGKITPIVPSWVDPPIVDLLVPVPNLIGCLYFSNQGKRYVIKVTFKENEKVSYRVGVIMLRHKIPTQFEVSLFDQAIQIVLNVYAREGNYVWIDSENESLKSKTMPSHVIPVVCSKAELYRRAEALADQLYPSTIQPGMETLIHEKETAWKKQIDAVTLSNLNEIANLIPEDTLADYFHSIHQRGPSEWMQVFTHLQFKYLRAMKSTIQQRNADLNRMIQQHAKEQKLNPDLKEFHLEEEIESKKNWKDHLIELYWEQKLEYLYLVVSVGYLLSQRSEWTYETLVNELFQGELLRGKSNMNKIFIPSKISSNASGDASEQVQSPFTREPLVKVRQGDSNEVGQACGSLYFSVSNFIYPC
jgi:hypothetical protein